MKRTRKWAYVEQEAKRLADLGLTPLEIARRIGVNKSTITRWMATGKLNRRTSANRSSPDQTPAQWAATVRKDYQLDATDEQLVTIAERALELSLDASIAPHVRMNAAGRFQALVRQLALVARSADQASPEKPQPEPTPARVEMAAVARRTVDPRKLLMAVK